MLSKDKRLKKKKEFNLTFSEGIIIEDDFFQVRVLKNQGNQKKIGLVAPVKIFSKAVERNKMKRKMGEVISFYFDKMSDGLNIIFIAKKKSQTKTVFEIKEIINKKINDINLVKENDC